MISPTSQPLRPSVTSPLISGPISPRDQDKSDPSRRLQRARQRNYLSPSEKPSYVSPHPSKTSSQSGYHGPSSFNHNFPELCKPQQQNVSLPYKELRPDVSPGDESNPRPPSISTDP